MQYKFLIYITYPYSIPIGVPLEQSIIKKGYEVRWFAEKESTKELIENQNIVLDSIQSAINYNPHIILTATDTVPDFFRGLKVQIFHGFPANKRAFTKDHFRIRGFFDLYTTHGPSTTSVFKELAEKYKTFDVIETGWSKLDPLFAAYPTSDIKKDIPIILISSTFTKRLSLTYNEDLIKEIIRIAHTGKYQFYCVLHPKLPQGIKDRFRNIESKFFKYFDTSNLTPIFLQADIMLSDTTSAISEFLMQKKIVVTFKNNKPQNYFYNITEVHELENALELALCKPSHIIRNIEEYIEESHPYTDGKSSDRIVESTINFLHKDKSYLKSKPLNLVRKWKLRKALGYFTLTSYNKPFTIDET